MAASTPQTVLHRAILLAFALGASTASNAAVRVVQNCDDDGPGSLRATVQAAASGDRIDLTRLSCSRVTLASGAIAFALDDLEMIGPGADRLALSGNEEFPVIQHAGAGTVQIGGLRIEKGNKYAATADAPGGCVYSQGNLVLDRVVVTRCEATANNGRRALGGGVFTAGDLVLLDSMVSGNDATGIGNASAAGGGVRVGGDLTMKYSVLDHNAATHALGEQTGGRGSAGGAVVYGDVLIRSSVIVGNDADRTGGLDLRGYYATQPLRIVNSTIAANTAAGVTRSAGIDAATELSLANSTITGNTMWFDTGAYPGSAAGVFVNLEAQVDSSVIAGNFADAFPFAALDAVPPALPVAGENPSPSDLGGHATATVTGSHDLVVASTLALPAGTLRGEPRLEPRIECPRDSHPSRKVYYEPRSDSPLVDAGANPLALDYDQRGEPHRRVRGAAADIGAIESNPERIFASDFEACGGLP